MSKLEDAMSSAVNLSPVDGASAIRDVLDAWVAVEHPSVAGGYVIVGMPVMVDLMKQAPLIDRRSSIGQVRRKVEGLRLQFFQGGQPLDRLLAAKIEGQHVWLWRARA